jgi:excisionase family DNA binding protein
MTASAAETERGLGMPPVRPANDERPVTDEVLNVEDVARVLRVGRNTIYELVGRHEIPSRRLGKQIRFSRGVRSSRPLLISVPAAPSRIA